MELFKVLLAKILLMWIHSTHLIFLLRSEMWTLHFMGAQIGWGEQREAQGWTNSGVKFMKFCLQWLSGEESAWCRSRRRCRFDPWVRKTPGGGHGNPLPVFLPGESHGQRSLEGYSPWGRKEMNRTELTWHSQGTSNWKKEIRKLRFCYQIQLKK